MFDTIEKLQSDVLISAGSDGPGLVERIDALWVYSNTEIATLREENLKSKALVRFRDNQIADQKRQIAKLQKMYFSSTSDHNPNKGRSPEDSKAGTDPTRQEAPSGVSNEPDLDPQAEQQDQRRSAPSNRSGRGKRIWPEHLERREIYMGEENRKCPCGCGGTIRGYDTNETLEVIPARYYVAVRTYPKYRCRATDKTVGTRFVPRIFPQTSMSNGLLANAICMRFSWQLPWYRQANILRASGIDLDRSTLMKWSNRLAIEALQPLYELMIGELRENSTRLFMDETTLPALQPGKGKTRTSYLYALLRDDRSFGGNKPPVVTYHPRHTRAMHHIHDILGGVSAIVQTDAYAGYGQLGKLGTAVEDIIPVKCWAHVRRHFTDEYEFNKTQDAGTAIALIEELYGEEKKVRGKPPIVREAHRRKYSVQILDRLWAFLTEFSDRHLKKSGMGKAIRYVQRIWGDLVRFVDDGRIDLDTNAVERMFKPTILLRKNALFIGSDEGAQAWGIHSSVVETCKLNGVNVEPYLKWVLDEIASKRRRSEYEPLLPWNAPSSFLIKR